MSIRSFLRSLVVDADLARRREDSERELQELRCEARQHAQVIRSSSRVMNTMAGMMKQLEADRGPHP